ncbi:MAG: NADH-quinone oxidoreductase subunit L [Chloroflexi bacterium]|nr:NADH-quinone oxidoreductase subunit L [Chloroflexota bacterium]
MADSLSLAWLIPLLPFAAFAIVGLFTQRKGELSSWLVIAATAVSCAISWMIFSQVHGGAASAAHPWERSIPWLALSVNTVLPFGIIIDPLTSMMLVVVTSVALLVQIYSRGYLWEPEAEHHDEHGDGHGDGHGGHGDGHGGDGDGHGDAHHAPSQAGPPPPLVRDPNYGRFFGYLGLFTAAMLGLVLANNLLVIYMFWEGVGLGSYLLIGFWYNRRHQTGSFINREGREIPILSGPAPAAMKAFVTTRLGDFGFLLGILWLWWHADTLEFTRLIEMAEHGELTSGILGVGCILLFTGAVGKSAQFPLHVWLPDAMEGPTPVSALIHAATMVAAGVYLVGRTFPLFEHAPAAMITVAFIGGFTAIFAASMGLVSTDIKRVMAFSTVSQLGYMMLAMGSYSEAAGAFHLFTHAFFKALLFLTAGSVIYALHRAGAPHVGYVETPNGRAQVVPAQDMRVMGGLFSRMPITAWTMIIAALSLAGIPPLSGFWSKDEILLVTLHSAERYGGVYWVLLGFALITVFMTAFYMFRVIFLTFGGTFRGSMDPRYIKESPLTMTLPLLILAVPSVLVGLWGAPQLGNGFAHFLEGDEFHGSEMNVGLAAIGTVLALAGIATAWAMYSAKSISAEALAARFRPVYVALFNRYWFDELYGWILDKFVVGVAMGMSWFDRNVVDGVVNGVGKGTTVAGDWLRDLQTGRIPSYALAVAGGLVIIAFWAVFFGIR